MNGKRKLVPATDQRRQPIPREAAAIEDAMAKYEARAARAELALRDVDGSKIISGVHNDEAGTSHMLRDAFGTTSDAFTDNQLANLFGAVSFGGKHPTNVQMSAALAFM